MRNRRDRRRDQVRGHGRDRRSKRRPAGCAADRDPRRGWLAIGLRGARDVGHARAGRSRSTASDLLDGGTGYHDHNWGFWEGVSWQWGRCSTRAVLRLRPRVSAARRRRSRPHARLPRGARTGRPDSATPADVTIAETNDPPPGRPRRIVVRGRGPALDLVMRLTVEDAVVTPFRGPVFRRSTWTSCSSACATPYRARPAIGPSSSRPPAPRRPFAGTSARPPLHKTSWAGQTPERRALYLLFVRPWSAAGAGGRHEEEPIVYGLVEAGALPALFAAGPIAAAIQDGAGMHRFIGHFGGHRGRWGGHGLPAPKRRRSTGNGREVDPAGHRRQRGAGARDAIVGGAIDDLFRLKERTR